MRLLVLAATQAAPEQTCRQARPSRLWLLVCATAAAATLFLVVAVRVSAGQPLSNGITGRPVAAAVRTTEAITIDGVLDEGAWQQAAAIGPLAQVEPNENSQASERTEIRILYDADTLYIGIQCSEPPTDVVSTQLGRDADLNPDDRVIITLDPFFDHRDGYFFAINPAGARVDGQIANNAQDLNRDWDGIWNAATHVTVAGWTAEIAIPFKTLRFNPDARSWGLNVERVLKRRNETDRWASPRHSSWVSNLADAGRLAGLSGLRQGLGLDIRPYASGGETNQRGELTGGLDVFKNLTPNLNASLTLNTDFAETEADTRQVNLTPFRLFFPEKRAFFLEGSGVFDVAGVGSDEDIVPFFSRQIGLLTNPFTGETEPVPVRAGAKLIGRQGAYNVGLLDVETGASAPAGVDRQNLFAARISRNLLQQSSVGAIVTRGSPAGGSNTLIGADARFATSTWHGDRNLSLSLFALRTRDERAGTDQAFGIGVDYPNDLWDVNASWKQIGDRFDPALGFVSRTGIRKADLGIAFQPRPRGTFIRQMFFEFRPDYITDLHNQVVDWRVFMAPFNIETNSGEHLEFNVVPQFERLDEPFAISDTVTLPVGSYRWLRTRTQVNTATKRRWVLDFTWWRGGFYDGTDRELTIGLTLKPSARVLLSLFADRHDIALREGRFHTQILTLRNDLNFSPNVSWANLVQYDNVSRVLGAQSRFHWILTPGRDVYLVVNRGWTRTLDGRFEPSFDNASAKLQYTLRF